MAETPLLRSKEAEYRRREELSTAVAQCPSGYDQWLRELLDEFRLRDRFFR